MKQKKYSGLNQLLRCDREAEDLFTLLPDSVREQLLAAPEDICSLRELRSRSGDLLRRS